MHYLGKPSSLFWTCRKLNTCWWWDFLSMDLNHSIWNFLFLFYFFWNILLDNLVKIFLEIRRKIKLNSVQRQESDLLNWSKMSQEIFNVTNGVTRFSTVAIYKLQSKPTLLQVLIYFTNVIFKTPYIGRLFLFKSICYMGSFIFLVYCRVIYDYWHFFLKDFMDLTKKKMMIPY